MSDLSNTIATGLIAFWGLAHVGFGVVTTVMAHNNDLGSAYKALMGGHPRVAELAKLQSPVRGPDALLRQHGFNLLIIGAVAMATAKYLMREPDLHTYGLASFFFTGMVFLDHNAYGLSIDIMEGYAELPGKLMLYVANTGFLLHSMHLARHGVIGEQTLDLVKLGTIAFMVLGTLATVVRSKLTVKVSKTA